MKFNFKKVSAVASSLLMLGMTAGFAAAATFPAPFSSSTASGVGVVSGSGAGVDDGVARSSIANYLATMVRTSGGVPTGGDSVLIAKSSDNLNLGDTWGVFTGSVDDDDLSTLLADGTYIADDNDEFDYEQKITLGTPTLTHFRDSDYEGLVGLSTRTPVIGFKFSSSTFVMNYTLDFTQDAESDVVGTDLDDIEGSDLTLFGKTFYVSDAKNGTAAGNFGKFTLLDSAVTSNVAEGETASVSVGTKTYQVSLDFIGSSTVKFNINGELTNTLSTGQTFRLADNAYIGVREINTQDYQGGIKTVEFSIGSGKLELTHGSDVKLNDDTLQGVVAFLEKGTYSDGVNKIDKIVIRWITDDEEFITAETELEMPGFGGVKFTMADFVRANEEKVVVQPHDDFSIEMTVPVKDGPVTFDLLFSTSSSSGNFTGIGRATDERLATSNSSTLDFFEKKNSLDYDEWFVASYNISSEAESYLLRAKVTEDTNDGRNETTVQKKVGTTWVDVCVEKINGDSCDIGLVTLTIGVINKTSTEESVVFTAGSNVNFNTIYTKGGLRIYLPWETHANSSVQGAINFTTSDVVAGGTVGHDADSWYLEFDGEDKDDDIAAGTEFNMTLDNTASTNNPLHISQVNRQGTGGPSGLEVGSSTSIYEAYIVDDVAPRILHYTNPDEDWAEVYYPSVQSESYATVFLTEIGSVVSGTAGNMVFTDAEKSSWEGRDVILVGGSCINSATASALGHSYPTCASAWEAATGVGSGQFLIQSVGSAFTSGKIALVVAGYSQSDTAAGASRIANQPGTIDTTAGNKYIFAASTTGGSTKLSGP